MNCEILIILQLLCSWINYYLFQSNVIFALKSLKYFVIYFSVQRELSQEDGFIFRVKRPVILF